MRQGNAPCLPTPSPASSLLRSLPHPPRTQAQLPNYQTQTNTTRDGLAECYHSGIAKNVGVSNYGPTLLERAHEHLAKRGVPLASNQIHLNLL